MAGWLMKDTRDTGIESYKWTAFLKLKGQTSLRNEEEILDEFDGLVQSLQRVGVDYNIIVMVEGRAPRQLHLHTTRERRKPRSLERDLVHNNGQVHTVRGRRHVRDTSVRGKEKRRHRAATA